MVRCNELGNLGFLTERRRLNVAITRAKRQLVLICNPETICRDEFLDKFVQYMRETGETHMAPNIHDIKHNLKIP